MVGLVSDPKVEGSKPSAENTRPAHPGSGAVLPAFGLAQWKRVGPIDTGVLFCFAANQFQLRGERGPNSCSRGTGGAGHLEL